MYLLLVYAYWCMACHIPPLMPFSTISNILPSINNSNVTSVIFRHACNANPGADKKYARSGSFISIHLLQKFLNVFANSIVSLYKYRS